MMQSADVKLHVVTKFIRFVLYRAARYEPTGLLKSHSVQPA